MIREGLNIGERAAYVVLDTDGELWGPFLTFEDSCQWAKNHWPEQDPQPDVDWSLQFILPPNDAP